MQYVIGRKRVSNMTVVADIKNIRPKENAILPTLELKLKWTNVPKRTGESEYRSENVNWAVYTMDPLPYQYLGSIISQELLGSIIQENESFTLNLEIDHIRLNAIEQARRKSLSSKKDVGLLLKGMVLYRSKENIVPHADLIDIHYKEYPANSVIITEDEWIGYMKEWGKSVKSITVFDHSAKKLQEIWQKVSASSDEDFIEKVYETQIEFEKLKKGEKISQYFVCTLPDERSIKDKAREVLNRVASNKSSALICGWVGSTLEPDIQNILKNGGEVKIICRPEEPGKEVKDVLERIKKSGADIKKDKMMHARVIVGDGECMIMSADMNTFSLDSSREAGVYTTDPVVSERAKRFFEKVWEESK